MVIRVVCEYCGETNDGMSQIECHGCGHGLPENKPAPHPQLPGYAPASSFDTVLPTNRAVCSSTPY